MTTMDKLLKIHLFKNDLGGTTNIQNGCKCRDFSQLWPMRDFNETRVSYFI